MIDILGNSGRISEMREVINQIKDDSCECKDSVFSFAIKTYASHGLLEEVYPCLKALGDLTVQIEHKVSIPFWRFS